MSAYRRDIDGLRAVAVIPVVLHHAGVTALSGGFVGVDVFFVISGFLITGIIRDELNAKSFSLLGFYERRARRILPALFFMLGACFVAGWIILLPDEFSAFAKSVGATTVFSSNFWFWRAADGGYFDDASEFLPLLHTWSLAVEEQFYLLFPLLLMVLSPRGRLVTALIVGGGTLASLALATAAVERWQSLAFYLAPTRAWELGLGALVALAPMPRLSARWSREILAGAGLIAILFAAFFYDQSTPFPGPAALLPCLGAAAILVAGGAGKSIAGALLSWRPVVFIGAISYSLYLWHWPILSFLRLRFQTLDLPLAWAAAAVAAAFVMATVSWAFVERPFRNRAFLKRGAVFALSGAAAAVTIAASAALWAGAGVPERIPSAALVIADAANDTNPQREECFEVWPPLAAPTGDLCQLGTGAPGPTDFLFWGDSHADALFPGMDRAARSAGRSGLFVGAIGCPPLLGVDRAAFDGCRSFNDAVIELLRDRDDIGTIILYARWPFYETGTATAGDPNGNLIIVSDEHAIGNPGSNAAVFEAGLRRTVESIVGSGRKVVIIWGTPEFEWDVPRRLYVYNRWGDPPQPIPSFATLQHRNAGVISVLEDLARNDNVSLVSLAPLLCPGQCMLMHQGRSIYSDNNHLTRFASQHLVAPFLVENVFSADSQSGLR